MAERQPMTPGKAKVVKGGLTGGAAVALIIAAILRVEGGYVNDPHDRGGETNKGITKRVAVAHGYTGPMRNLPTDVAGRIYRVDYIEKPGFMPMVNIEPAVAEELVDTAVNMGPDKPSRWFQESLNELNRAGLKVDGKVGDGTISAYISFQLKAGPVGSCVRVLAKLDGKQLARYEAIVRANPSQVRFLKGWKANRIGNVNRAMCGRGL